MFDVARGVVCRLQRPNVEDHAVIVKWLRDPYLGTTVFDSDNFVGEPEEQAKFWIEQNAELYGANELTLIARRLSDDLPVGLLLLKNVDWRSGTADIHYLVGEESLRNAVFGPEIALLGLLWAFHTLNLHKIYGYVLSSNLVSNKMAVFSTKAEGVLKKYVYSETGWLDYHLYSLTAGDFNEFLLKNREGVLRRHFRDGLIRL